MGKWVKLAVWDNNIKFYLYFIHNTIKNPPMVCGTNESRGSTQSELGIKDDKISSEDKTASLLGQQNRGLL